MPADVNSVNDEIKNEIKKVLATKHGWEKFKYFVYYYKVQAIVVVVSIAILVSVIYDLATRKDCIFQIMVVNGEYSETLDYGPFKDAFASTLEYDEKKEEVILDPSTHVDIYAGDQVNQMTIQKVFLNVSAADLDVILCDEDFMRLTCAQDCAYDLSKLLTPEQMEEYGDRIHWYDFPPEEVGDDEEYKDRYEAAAIDISDCPKIKENNMFPYGNGKAYLIVVANAPHMDTVLKFIDYLEQ